MKRLLTISLFILFSISAFAQSELYKKYSKTEGITKVYISKSLLSLFDQEDGSSQLNFSDQVDVSSVVKKLTGIYVLSCSNTDVAKNMTKDFLNIISKGKYELLMEAEDGETRCEIYIKRNQDWISELYVFANDQQECSLIQITGELTQEDLNQIAKSARDE